ncbi:MAG: hypothetical protein JKY48_06420 [Flavobacteriales bacterium]|nr:hypothetical protein [Flavobacteriales bacterium]
MSIKSSIPILVVAYNRPNSLLRLLKSLSQAIFESDSIELIISIDKSDTIVTETVAQNFHWPHGTKEIIASSDHLGLKNHLLKCGSLLKKYEEIIVLEDDLIVSPYFYYYSIQACKYYKNDPNIASISLHSPRINEFTRKPFHPITNGDDVYFMQVPSSCGQIWFKRIWSDFEFFLLSEKVEIKNTDRLPLKVKNGWGENTWKKFFFKFSVINGLYTLFPRESYSSNTGDPGTHFNQSTQNFQTNLILGKRSLNFSTFSNSTFKYDHHLELIPESMKLLNPALVPYDFETDLLGLKERNVIKSPYLLSSKPCKNPTLSYGANLFIPELNIAFNIEGDDYSLGLLSDFELEQ